MKKFLTILGMFILTLSTIFILILYNKVDDFRDYANKTFEDVKTNLVYTRTERIEGINKLNKILENEKYIDKDLRTNIVSELGKFYALNGAYLESIECLVQGINLAIKNENNFIVCKNIINLSTEYINLQGYETAIDTLNYGLTLEIENESQNNKIKEYIYLNLADIYTRINDTEKAKEYLYKSYDYANENKNKDIRSDDARKVIAANILLIHNKVNEAEKLLESININGKDVVIVDEYIPYLLLKSKIEFINGNNEEGIRIANILFDACESEQQVDIELNSINELLKTLKENNDESKSEIISIFNDKLMTLYKQVVSDKNKNSVSYIIENIDKKMIEFEYMNNKIKLNYFISTIITLAIAGFVILIYMLGKSKNQNMRDGLTDINNRRYFDIKYNKYIKSDKKFGLIILDVDKFKSINDTYGHSFGDEVLRKLAKTIKFNLSHSEMVFRYGGEEFCILCKKENIESVANLAQKIRHEVENLVWENNIKVTISAGVSFNNKGNDVFKEADENLYKSKSNGRNKVTS